MASLSEADTALWDRSPVAALVIEAGLVVRLNEACRDLFGTKEIAPDEILHRRDWDRLVFDEKNRERFQRLLAGTEHSATVELVTENGRRIHLTARKKELAGDWPLTLLAFQDVTEIRENSQAFQAGYDEFLKVTIELELALGTIESQKELLQRQKDILQKELHIAHNVQSRLFAEDFERFKRIRVHGYYRAMSELGGDMWELFESDQAFMAVLGDVMGHGVGPSLISMAAKTLFKKSFEDLSYRPESLARVCERLNRELLQITNGDYYITICCVRIDHDNRMEFITNGHPPIMIVPGDPAAPFRLVNTDQPMLGILPRVQLRSDTTQLHPGDRVLLYTDCLVESLSPNGEALNLSELVDLIRLKNDGPRDATQALIAYLTRFLGSSDFDDDLTLICLEVPG